MNQTDLDALHLFVYVIVTFITLSILYVYGSWRVKRKRMKEEDEFWRKRRTAIDNGTYRSSTYYLGKALDEAIALRKLKQKQIGNGYPRT